MTENPEQCTHVTNKCGEQRGPRSLTYQPAAVMCTCTGILYYCFPFLLLVRTVSQKVVEECAASAKLSPAAANVQTWVLDDRTTFHTGTLPARTEGKQSSDTHVMASLYAPAEYSKRIVAFFTAKLGNYSC